MQNGNDTLAAGDSVDGGAGTDRLNVFNDANIGQFANASVSNVEQVYAQFDGTTGVDNLNVSTNADVTQAWVSGGTLAANDIVTLTKAQTAGVAGTVAGAGTLAFVFSDASAATGDVATLALNGANTTALTTVTIADIETLNVSSTGTNVLGTVVAAAATTVNVTGTGTLSATLASAAITTIDASASTGAMTLIATASAGNTQTITTGTGVDTITTTYAGLAGTDTINLGDGVDSLIFTDVATFNDAATAARLAKVTGVEKLGTVGVALTIDGDNVSQNIFTTSGVGSFAITDAANNTTLEFGAGVAGVSTAALKLGASTLNVELNGSTAAAADASNGLTVTGSSTINVESNGTAGVATNVLDLTAADNQSVVITGSQALTLTTTNAPSTTGFSIDGSAATGVLNITGTNDIDIIKGGSAADTISGGLGADEMTGNGGADTFTVETAAPATAAAADIVTDFLSGTDKLSFNTNTPTAVGSAANYSEGTAAVATYAAALAAATTALGVAVVYSAQQVGADTFVFVDGNTDGALTTATEDFVVQLSGVALDGIEFGDIVA